ncbi:MAG: leucine-rich repeat domain-containing protein [Ruminococcaceae bacterium]|nr:leucine-rich repeat domain-containing protein [Oscillospiraceae bacterium]
MKNILKNIILSCSLFIACAMMLSSCAEDAVGSTTANTAEAHTHEWKEWLTRFPTCMEDGYRSVACECGEFELFPIEATGHKEGDWVAAEGAAETEKGVLHQLCEFCGEVLETKTLYPDSAGLIYIYNNEGYSADGIGRCTDSKIIIPRYYYGLPVTGINNGAFKNCDTITCVVIPEGVISIGNSAFLKCTKLESVIIPSGARKIGAMAFQHCDSLERVFIPEGLSLMMNRAFEYCVNLEKIEIPYGVISIGSYAFHGCESLVSVDMPKSLRKIYSGTFSGCTALSAINFDGTKEEWVAIQKDSDWDANTGEYTVYCIDGNLTKAQTN